MPASEDFEKITKELLSLKFKNIKDNLEGRKKNDFKSLLRSMFSKTYGASLVDYCLQLSNIEDTIDLDIISHEDSKEFKALLKGFEKIDTLIQQSIHKNKGYIAIKNHPDFEEYLDYQPFQPLFGDFKEFETFNLAVDQFYYNKETQKSHQKLLQVEKQAQKKLAQVLKNSENLVKSYQLSKLEKEVRASAIENNVELVTACCETVSTLLKSGMDWNDIEVK